MFPNPEYSAERIFFQLGAFLVVATICAYFLYNSEKEAMRLLDLSKKSYPDKKIENDAKELKKIGRGVSILYAILLAVCILASVFHGIELFSRM